MKHSKFTKVLAVLMAVALLIPGGAILASADCDHDFSVQEIVAEATCTTDRVSYYRCSKCDEVEKNSSGDPIEYHSGKTLHDLIYYLEADDDAYYTSRTAPTCVDAGYTDYCCAICDEVIWTLNADPLGHNGVWIIEQEATEDHDGVAAERCTRCGEVLDTDSFSQHLHVYDDGYRTGYKRILTPATCTVDGEMGVFCAICGALFDVETIDATGHSNAQWADYMTSLNDLEDYIGCTNVVTTMPTCTKDGVITFLCDECGEVVRSYPLDKIGHHNACLTHYYSHADAELEDYIGFMNVETTMPTCTKDGSISFLCDDCGIVIYTRKLAATGHYNDQLNWYLTDADATLDDVLGFTNVVVTTEPTCTKKGVVTFMCDVCGEAMRSYPLDKLDHTEGYQKEIKAPTCMNVGEMGVYCANCGELYDTIEIAALGHDYGEWTPNGDKTHSRSCSRCTFTDKATCKFNATVTDPTCTEGGYTTYVCTDCGFTYQDNFTDPLGHDWGAWTDDGDETHSRVCARCSEKETEEHCFGDWVYNHDAKFFKNGTKSCTCDVCGKVITEKAKHTAWIWHLFYPIILWVGTIVHKSLFLGSLTWFLPFLNIVPKI